MAEEREFQELEDKIDAYFKSIKSAFETTLEAEEQRKGGYDGSKVTFTFFLCLLFSLIPVLPACLYFSVHWIAHHPPHYSHLTLGSELLHRLGSQTFLYSYLFCSGASALLFGLRLKYSSIKSKKSKPSTNPDELLSNSQMRFALCYSTQQEIEVYRTNRRLIHMKTANRYWRKLLFSLQQFLGSGYWSSDPTDLMLIQTAPFTTTQRRFGKRFFPQVHILLDTFSWFKVEPGTEAVLSAFDGMRLKLNDRLRDRKDLFEISRCLLPLSMYLYALIPEIADTEEERARLATSETFAIEEFAAQMGILPEYKAERRSRSQSAKLTAKKARITAILQKTVGNGSPFLRFLSIWLVLQVIVGVAVWIFLAAIKSLKLDSTLIALLIGSPFAIAAALTAIPIRPSGDEGV